jgi:hypothetical protein
MTVTLNLPPEKEAAFKAQAQARGLSLEQWMLEVVDQACAAGFRCPSAENRPKGVGATLRCLG